MVIKKYYEIKCLKCVRFVLGLRRIVSEAVFQTLCQLCHIVYLTDENIKCHILNVVKFDLTLYITIHSNLIYFLSYIRISKLSVGLIKREKELKILRLQRKS